MNYNNLLLSLKKVFDSKLHSKTVFEPIPYLNVSLSNSEWNKASIAFAKSEDISYNKQDLIISYPKVGRENSNNPFSPSKLTTSDWNKLMLSNKKTNKAFKRN
ncbi:hypothetical protein WNY63_21410 [Pseudoalteromonas neustonica]|uniref:Uncharacterized protein n=1 Tax=Pseudoalteromonas neustonica TaxID=1840331 RepID=A0ABU9UA79_9GAMM